MDTANDNSSTTTVTAVQHVTKKSSDELLRKFAEMDGDEDDDNEAKKLELMRVLRRRKRRRTRRDHHLEGGLCESPSHYAASNGLVERRSLLPSVTRKSFRLLGIGRSQLIKARDVKNKSILRSIEKTWRKTLEGASRVLLEKHYNQHRRLINDMV